MNHQKLEQNLKGEYIMLFSNWNKKNSGTSKTNKVKVDRESVCMGDDCNAPHEVTLLVPDNIPLSIVFDRITEYLPKMSNVVWAIDSGRKVVGYILTDNEGTSRYEIYEQKSNIGNMGIEMLHCSYFHSNSFTNMGNKMVEEYLGCGTLIEKVKRCMSHRFVDELLINGGCLSIWGEYFGRPHDNFHRIETVRWERDNISIHFSEGESLYVTEPVGIINSEHKFAIQDATKVLWVWYCYGKEQSYENMLVRQYEKDGKGMIIRAEGKRSQIKDGDGIAFQPSVKFAVNLG